MSKTKRKGQFTGKVATRSRFGDDHEAMTIEFTGEAAEAFANCTAGQFIQIACRDLSDQNDFTPMLRRPISLAGKRVYKDRTEIDIIFRIIGPGTKRLSKFPPGRELDIMGPLGNGFAVPKNADSKAILIGGGIGLPPMFFLADMLEQAGIEKIAIGAARTAATIEDAIIDDSPSDQPLVPGKHLAHFVRSNTLSIVATDDGTCGFRGNAIDALKGYVAENPEWKNADIYCCGPDVMLKFAHLYAQENNVKCFVCMEAYMSCGIGLCQSCAVEAQTVKPDIEGPKYKLVCVNGPVFDSSEIIWK